MSPLSTNDAYMHCETFSLMMSYPAMSLGNRFCISRKGRSGGGGWVHLKGANDMSGLGMPFVLYLNVNGPRKQFSYPSHLV